MKELFRNIKFEINEKIYVKDPESSDLGKKILKESILLINEIGFESFTFKKLGLKIGSNESSIYRYFENKHKLLIYLCSWYWSWIEYRILFETNNITDANIKLEKAITIVTEKIEDDESTQYINESILNQIVIEEFTKTILTKEVDSENKEGFFLIYKRVVKLLVELIESVNPNYQYAKSLASTMIEGSLHQHFLKNHLKSITNCSNEITPTDFYIKLTFKILE